LTKMMLIHVFAASCYSDLGLVVSLGDTL